MYAHTKTCTQMFKRALLVLARGETEMSVNKIF